MEYIFCFPPVIRVLLRFCRTYRYSRGWHLSFLPPRNPSTMIFLLLREPLIAVATSCVAHFFMFVCFFRQDPSVPAAVGFVPYMIHQVYWLRIRRTHQNYHPHQHHPPYPHDETNTDTPTNSHTNIPTNTNANTTLQLHSKSFFQSRNPTW